MLKGEKFGCAWLRLEPQCRKRWLIPGLGLWGNRALKAAFFDPGPSEILPCDELRCGYAANGPTGMARLHPHRKLWTMSGLMAGPF